MTGTRDIVTVARWNKSANACYFELKNGITFRVSSVHSDARLDTSKSNYAVYEQVSINTRVADPREEKCKSTTPLIFEQSKAGEVPEKVLISNQEKYLEHCSFTLYRKNDAGNLQTLFVGYSYLRYFGDCNLSFDRTWEAWEARNAGKIAVQTVTHHFDWCRKDQRVIFHL